MTEIIDNGMTMDVAAVDSLEQCLQISCMEYRVVIEPGEDGVFVAMCPSLIGCTSQGATFAEALTNLKHAMTKHLAGLKSVS